MLKIIPLGGLGEIGLNMMAFEHEGSIFVIDAGLMFPEDYMLGVDFVIPDMEYLRQNSSRVSGIILTHAHEDHIGALPFLLKEVKAPVFGSPFTLGIVKHKLEEYDLLANAALHEIHPRETLKIGACEIEFIRVGHSVVDGVGLAIQTPYGVIIHTGDFKINYSAQAEFRTDVNRFAQWGEKGVLALLSDSTNVEKEGYTISPQEIAETLKKTIEKSRGRVIVALFASNIMRIRQLVGMANELGRKVIIEGRSISASVSIANKLGWIGISPSTSLDVDHVNEYPDDQIIIITTGSQGEPMSALARMAAGTHKKIKIKPDDTIILSSKFIPGNEKAIGKIINDLYRLGAKVIYEKISHIHVSGHAFQEELKLMINLTQPRYFLPIHGEYRHLALHAKLAESVGIAKSNILLAENGQIIEFDRSGGRVRGKVVSGRVLIDGKGIGDVGRSVLKERRALSEEGVVAVTLAFDEETGVVVYGPEIVSRGFVFETETGHLLDDAHCVVLEIVEEVAPEVPNRIRIIRSRIQTALRQYFFFAIGRRPVILPFIMQI